MGVKRAIDIALQMAKKHHVPLYTYGPLIHNPHVLEMLKKKGIQETRDPFSIKKGILLIRAHGISPMERQKLEETGLTLIDATCPRVERIHRQIRKYQAKNYRSIIFGDPNHAEVIGILGTAGESGAHVTSVEDVLSLPPLSEPVLLVAQTTQSRTSYNRIIDAVNEKYSHVTVLDTLCRTTEERQDEVSRLARTHDAVIVVGGKNSANTARLAEISAELGSRAFHVENEEDLPTEFGPSVRSIAITAGASTPYWMIERVVERLEMMDRKATPLNRILDMVRALTESNILVALGSASLALTCSFIMGISIQLLPIVIASCYVYSMHILNHFADRESVAVNEPLREDIFKRHQSVFLFFGVLTGILSLILSAFLGTMAFLLLAIATATGCAFSFNIVPRFFVKYIGFRRLKDIPASKDIVIALAWSSVTVLVPFFAAHETSLLYFYSLAWAWLFSSVLVYVRSILLDVKDIQGDRMVGKETLALLLGQNKVFNWVYVLLAIEIILIIVPVLFDWLPGAFLFQLWTLLPFLMATLHFEQHYLKKRYYFQALLDAGFIYSGLATIFLLL